MEAPSWPHNSKLLVTGASGFIGRAVVAQALAAGIPVRATIRNRPLDIPSVEQVPIRIEDYAGLDSIFHGVTHVIHAAGLAHVFGKGQALSAHFTAVNEMGSMNVARAAVAAGVQHFVLVSSVAVYGPLSPMPCDENALCRPSGPYAESKWRAERQVAKILSDAGMPITVLRLATVYGEGDPGNVSRLVRAIDRGRFFWIGSGQNRKSLVHRDDAARACLAAIAAPADDVRVFNVSAPPCSMRQIVETIAAALGKRVPRWELPGSVALGLTTLLSTLAAGRGPLGSLPATTLKWLSDDVYSSSPFEKSFGFQASVPLNAGLQRQVAWYRRRISTAIGMGFARP